MCKQNGDAAMEGRDWVLAVHWFEKALGAVLQVEDTPVCKIMESLDTARQHVERQEVERERLEKQRREEARKLTYLTCCFLFLLMNAQTAPTN